MIKYYSTEIKNPKPKCGSSKMLVAFKLLSIWGGGLLYPHPTPYWRLSPEPWVLDKYSTTELSPQLYRWVVSLALRSCVLFVFCFCRYYPLGVRWFYKLGKLGKKIPNISLSKPNGYPSFITRENESVAERLARWFIGWFHAHITLVEDQSSVPSTCCCL